MTREEAIKELNHLATARERDPRMPDIQGNHVRADEILMELLRSQNMGDVADTFDRVEKWYS
jgi:hypothetical protein